jgi:hypothetical protein
MRSLVGYRACTLLALYSASSTPIGASFFVFALQVNYALGLRWPGSLNH